VPEAQLTPAGHKDGEHDTPPSAARTPVELSRSASFVNAALSASFSGVSIDPPPFATQHRVYEVVGSDVLRNTLEGFNGCIFAYGQTGSGKTHTMMGDTTSSDTSGLVPRLVTTLFDQVSTMRGGDPSLSFRVECGYFEVYNERVFDLLYPSADDLRVRQDPVLGPFVEGLSWRHVSASESVLELIHLGNAERHTAATKMNDRSSRSHAILCVSVAQFRLQDDGSSAHVSSKLNLVDLAGSERTTQSGVEGVSFKEATKINLSLSTLGRVIDALADSSAGQKAAARPPYRDSLLTWLLMDSLGGNSKTAMIATLSPAATYYDEMLNTLRYACRARQIVNTVVVNEDPSVMKIKELQIINERLRKQVAALQASKISKEQLDEAEGRAANATKRVEDLRAELANFKSILSMRESNLQGLRQELATLKAASEGSPLHASLRGSTTSFARTASHTPLSMSRAPDSSFRRTASGLSSNAPLARGATRNPGWRPEGALRGARGRDPTAAGGAGQGAAAAVAAYGLTARRPRERRDAYQAVVGRHGALAGRIGTFAAAWASSAPRATRPPTARRPGRATPGRATVRPRAAPRAMSCSQSSSGRTRSSSRPPAARRSSRAAVTRPWRTSSSVWTTRARP
jgi:hypothetical protein